MVLTLAEEAQEKLIVDYLIAASLSKAKSKFVAKDKPNLKALLSTLVLSQDDNACRRLPQADPKRPPQLSPLHLLSMINSGRLI